MAVLFFACHVQQIGPVLLVIPIHYPIQIQIRIQVSRLPQRSLHNLQVRFRHLPIRVW